MLTTGNTNSLIAKYNSKKWYYYILPEHISYFDDKNTRLLFSSYKVEIKIYNFCHSAISLYLKSRLPFMLNFFNAINIGSGMIVVVTKK